MNETNRRQFLKIMGRSAFALGIGYPSLGRTKTNAHVVIIGGGFGGASCARYLRNFDTSIKITLIEKKAKFVTCPFSNAVLGGLYEMEFITHDYRKLINKSKVNVIQQKAKEIDPTAKKVLLENEETVKYDKLVVSPGIDFHWNAIENYSQSASDVFPHAWQAGPQTLLLKKQIQAMPDGGTVIISPPANPFRCPPGPYERASMIAHYLSIHKPKSKVLILDSKDKFSKQTLFQDAWDSFYPKSIEWVPAMDGGKVIKVDTKKKRVYTEDEEFKADVVNIIPPQKAGEIAFTADLVNDKGWCEVNQKTFESKRHKDIHVIGDACIAGKMPKSGYSANSQGKVCAAEIIADLQGISLKSSSWINTCYSLITPEYGISVAAVYRLKDGSITPVKGAGGVGPKEVPNAIRREEAKFAEGWYRSITTDIFE